MRGEPGLGAAEMPFTPRTRSVASRGQQLRDGNFPQCQPVGTTARGNFEWAAGDGNSTGQGRRPRGCALSLDIEVERPHPFACELVDPRRGRTAKDATAVNA